MVEALTFVCHNIVIAALLHHFTMTWRHVAMSAAIGLIEKSNGFYLAATRVNANTERAG